MKNKKIDLDFANEFHVEELEERLEMTRTTGLTDEQIKQATDAGANDWISHEPGEATYALSIW